MHDEDRYDVCRTRSRFASNAQLTALSLTFPIGIFIVHYLAQCKTDINDEAYGGIETNVIRFRETIVLKNSCILHSHKKEFSQIKIYVTNVRSKNIEVIKIRFLANKNLICLKKIHLRINERKR